MDMWQFEKCLSLFRQTRTLDASNPVSSNPFIVNWIDLLLATKVGSQVTYYDVLRGEPSEGLFIITYRLFHFIC